MPVTIKHTASAGGAGSITGEDLLAFASVIPPQATVDVSSYSDQREGTTWSMSASWDDATHKAWQGAQAPTLHYPPGVRSADDGQHRRPY